MAGQGVINAFSGKDQLIAKALAMNQGFFNNLGNMR
jgi:hypothetical protein